MAIDWTAGMQQTFEYYEVDPISWKDKALIDTITSSEITRDEELETLGSATIDATEEFGEIYVRIYLIARQNDEYEKVCLGTVIIQTPQDSFDGMIHSFSYDAYTALLELKDDMPPIGYYVPKDSNIMSMVSRIFWDRCRVPVISATANDTLISDFIAEESDTWLSYGKALAANARFDIGLDEYGRIIFPPKQEISALQPVWIYNDDNSSILQPQIDTSRDLYGIPNVVEVLYTTNTNVYIYKRVENNDPNSPTSTVSRGRVILHRETSPALNGNPTEEEIEKYAVNLLKQLSTLEYTLTYTHGYCPVRVGDGVLLNYERAGIYKTKAKVIRQRISCESGCQVEETAIYTRSLWG